MHCIILHSTAVDDDIVNQEVIRSALSSDHYEIHMAMNGFEALEFFSIRSQLPDLVLLDVMVSIVLLTKP